MKYKTLFLLLSIAACGDPLRAEILFLPEPAGELVVAPLNNTFTSDISVSSGSRMFTFFQRQEEFSPIVFSALAPIKLRATVSGADIDGDGIAEFITTGTDTATGNHHSQVFRTDGNESILPPAETELSGGIFASPYHAVDDFDGDGFPDLAVIQNDTVLVYTGDGRSFSAVPVSVSISISLLSRSLSTGDVDGDGLADLVGCGAEGGVVLFGASSLEGATLEGERVFSSSNLIKTRTADLDKDGLADVFAVGRNIATIEGFSFSTERDFSALEAIELEDFFEGPQVLGAVDFTFSEDASAFYVIRTVLDSNAQEAFDVAEVEMDLVNKTLLFIYQLPIELSANAPEIEMGKSSRNFTSVVVADGDKIRIQEVRSP